MKSQPPEDTRPTKSDVKSAIATRIKEARNDADLSQTRLANRAGVSDSAILRWEQETNLIPLHKLIWIARATGKDLPFFLKDFSDALAVADHVGTTWMEPEEKDPSEISVRMRDFMDLADEVEIYIGVSPTT